MDDWTRIPLFRDLSAPEILELQEVFWPVAVPAGKNLVTEGEVGTEMYILTQGRVRISKSMLVGNITLPALAMENPRKVLAVLDASQFPLIGEIALIDRDVRSATVFVEEDAQFLATDREHFLDLGRRNPALAFRLLLAVAERLAGTVRRANREVIKLTTALALALDRLAR
ncbi:hypothetical protein TDMWS_02100 [Thermodesulfomicrobium sp. WS]|uniref:Crp/Fnr family transcriptional regulator n=1 Tax=Thermodesulfomicrobium sp. WS TaxID=3004129 RepID=UPI002492D163|nr:cyclic nucleotide-binding domain-containing protein [Thermodesulfomicrobium sp. WS]BDV00125.1 hypothetical protein TDMWS_02100 [Thermodesulfomicrobium sp. WS]